jgi:hypothetical protein
VGGRPPHETGRRYKAIWSKVIATPRSDHLPSWRKVVTQHLNHDLPSWSDAYTEGMYDGVRERLANYTKLYGHMFMLPRVRINCRALKLTMKLGAGTTRERSQLSVEQLCLRK